MTAKTQKKIGESFQPSNVNFEASNYSEVIDLANSKLSPPPIMEDVFTESVQELRSTKVIPEFEFINFPYHTKSVETITESSGKICEEENRDCFISATLLS